MRLSGFCYFQHLCWCFYSYKRFILKHLLCLLLEETLCWESHRTREETGPLTEDRGQEAVCAQVSTEQRKRRQTGTISDTQVLLESETRPSVLARLEGNTFKGRSLKTAWSYCVFPPLLETGPWTEDTILYMLNISPLKVEILIIKIKKQQIFMFVSHQKLLH